MAAEEQDESTGIVARLKQRSQLHNEAINALNGEVNGLKGEVTAVSLAAKHTSAEVTGFSAGFKLFNAEKTLFDFEEMRNRRAGLDPESLKAEIAALRTRVTAVAATADRALAQQRAGAVAARPLASRPDHVNDFHQAAVAISGLETRLNALINALG